MVQLRLLDDISMDIDRSNDPFFHRFYIDNYVGFVSSMGIVVSNDQGCYIFCKRNRVEVLTALER